jgi:hypothetical protein
LVTTVAFVAAIAGWMTPVQAVETCLGQPATLVGTTGADVIYGTPGADVIVGKGGNDWIDGAGSGDRICGGDAVDVLIGGTGDDRLSGGQGTDNLTGGAGVDAVDGGLGVDACQGETRTNCEEAAVPEFTEGNAHAWGTFAADGRAASVGNDPFAKVGFQSIRFDTASGNDSGPLFPTTGNAHWDLRSDNYLIFWAYVMNPNANGFQYNPAVVLRGPNGSIRYEATPSHIYFDSWHLYRIPLAGDETWVRTQTGTVSLADISRFEFHNDTWDYGYTLYLDGLDFTTLTPPGPPPPGPPPPAGVNPNVIAPKVLLFVYDPIVESMGGQRMHEAYGWGDPATLANGMVNDLKTSSHGRLRYRIVDTKIVDAYPHFVDGFQYDDDTFAQDWAARTPHQSVFDYARFVAENGIAPRIEDGRLDEVWVYGFPYTGMYESTMAGNGGYACNSPPVKGVPSSRLFVIMGLNYERGVAEAIHSYGHRTESIMVHSYGPRQPDQSNNWNRFTLIDQDAPGSGGVGYVHFPVNGTADYDYANPTVVTSNADDWYNYPNFKGLTRAFNFREWSPNRVDPQREYLNWWYDHMPHMAGAGPDRFLNNWWRYIADPDQFKAWDGNLLFASGIPTVSTVSPTDGSSVTGVITVRAVAGADQDTALGRVDLYVDGVFRASDSMAPYTFRWDTAGLTGTHRLVTKAYDLQAGTEAVAKTVTVTVS